MGTTMAEVVLDTAAKSDPGAGPIGRYYFRHRQGTVSVADLEGAEFSSLEAAECEAISSLREIIAGMLLTIDEMLWDGAIEIVSETGEVLRTVTYLVAAGVPDR
jgi:hypothetical protein